MQHGAEPPHYPAPLKLVRGVEEFLQRYAQTLSHWAERARSQRRILLQFAYNRNVKVGYRLRLVPRLPVGSVIPVGAVVLLGGALFLDHIEVHAYLEELNGRHQAICLRARALGHFGYAFGEIFVGRHGEREPQVEIAVARVVVADARMLVDDMRRRVQLVVGKAHRHQRSLVAKPPRIKNGANLPHHILALKIPDALNHLILAQANLGGNIGIRPLNQRKARLDDVQNVAVGQVHS